MGPFTDFKDKTKFADTCTKSVYSLTCHKGTHLSFLTFQQGFEGVGKESTVYRVERGTTNTVYLWQMFVWWDFWKQRNILVVYLVHLAALGDQSG